MGNHRVDGTRAIITEALRNLNQSTGRDRKIIDNQCCFPTDIADNLLHQNLLIMGRTLFIGNRE